MVAIGGISNQNYNNFIVDNSVKEQAPAASSNDVAVKSSYNENNDSFVANNQGASKKVDADYYKTSGALKSPAITSGNISGYDVSVDGSSTKVITDGGREFSDYIAGKNIAKGIEFEGSGGFIRLPNFSLGLGLDNQGIGASMSIGNWMVDGRHNYSSDGEGLLSSNMGDLAGSTLVGLRYMFANNYVNGNIGVVGGDAGSLTTADGSGFIALGGHADVHFGDKTLLDGKLRLSADAANTLSLPVIFGNGNPNIGDNVVATSLLSARAEYDLNNFTFGAGYNANVDFAHTIHNLNSAGSFSLPTTRFAEASVNYAGSNWNAAANVYVPLTIYDNSFSDQLSWNVQGSYTLKDTSLQVKGSISGNFDSSPVSKIGVGIDNGLIDVGVNLSGIDSGKTSLGFHANVDLTTAVFSGLFL